MDRSVTYAFNFFNAFEMFTLGEGTSMNCATSMRVSKTIELILKFYD